MPDAIPLRVATTADASAIAGLIRLSFSAQTVVTDPLPSARMETTASVTGHFTAGGGGAVAGDLVAAVLWAKKEGGLYLSRLSVHPRSRRLGLARRLIALAEHEARARGLPRVHLATRLVLVDNRRLFAACGFVETALHAHPGYAAPTFVDMEKILT